MSKELNERVLECITASGLVDDGQRSAIGMARGWLDSGELKLSAAEVEGLFKKRDALAESLVGIIREAKKGDAIVALAAAREVINEPYQDPTMAGFRARRLKQGVVGSEKKGEKLASKNGTGK